MEYIIKEIKKEDRDFNLIEDILKVWEDSVKKTHLFLSDNEIENIKTYVPDMLIKIPYLIVMENNGSIIGFMGMGERKLEMLSLSPVEMGKGIGKRLIKHGMNKYFINELCVNEQNPNAKVFYEHMGFFVYKRDELDEQGNPYPILHMKLKNKI